MSIGQFDMSIVHCGLKLAAIVVGAANATGTAQSSCPSPCRVGVKREWSFPVLVFLSKDVCRSATVRGYETQRSGAIQKDWLLRDLHR